MDKKYEIHKQNIDKKSKLLKREIDIYHQLKKIIKPDKKSWLYKEKDQEIETLIKENLRYILPHGSGIDAEWYFEFCKNGTIICRNSFHAINENGYYVRWIPISVRIYRHKRNVYKCRINEIKYQIMSEKGKLNWELRTPNSGHCAYMLKDSLYESFENVLGILDECNLKIVSEDKLIKPYTIE